MTVEPATWHRVEINISTALARTQITLLGALDNRAIAVIDETIAFARANGHTLTFELSQMSSITPAALSTLLARSHRPNRGPLELTSGRAST
jgi:hypothetical protein